MRKALSERFWSKVDMTAGPDECWPYLGYRNDDGYGKFNIKGVNKIAHRVAYCLANSLSLSAIDGMVVMHSCDNPPCQNPAHLRLGTSADNNLDAKSKGRHFHGQMLGISRLTEEQVKAIKDCAGVLPATRIALIAGVSDSLVSRILRGKNWSHINGAEVSD